MLDTPATIVADEINRIVGVAPFDRIPATILGVVLNAAPLVFHRHGSVICHPETTGPAQRLWLVRQGSVRQSPPDRATSPLPEEHIHTEGALLPLECALEAARPQDCHVAQEDSFLWRLEGPLLDALLAEPAFLGWLAAHWQRENQALRAAAAGLVHSRQIADQALALPARTAGSGAIVCVPAESSLRQVAGLMAERKIGSVVVGTAGNACGIVTQSDFVRRAVANGVDLEAPIAQIMTEAPACVEESCTVVEAGAEMARSGHRHLLIRSTEGDVCGIVSERDLFRIQQQGIAHVFKPIGEAPSVEAMAEISARVRELAERVFRQGMEVSQFARLVSSINDHIAQRLLVLITAARAPGLRFCWLAFGSEGREEQGFVTDQDNGICFVPPAGTGVELAREELLGIAREMNDALHACGFERCKGNIMAGNPEWCLSLDEWKDRFTSWITATTPGALLNATIFFDFRAIHGDADLAEAMRDHLLGAARGNTIFLTMLARNALQVAPPLGRISRFTTAGGEHKGTLNLKTQGSRLFVDVARIYALAHGVRASNTEQRLRIGGGLSKRAPMAIEGDVAALRFIQKIRLQRQLDSLRDGGDPNRLDPYLINEVEQRILRESLHQAQVLQDRLRLEFQR